MKKQTVCIAGLVLLTSLAMSSAMAGINPIPNLVTYARYFVAADVIQHSFMDLQQNVPVRIDDQQFTTSPPLPIPDAQPDELVQDDIALVNADPRPIRGGDLTARQGVRLRRERMRP
jgi:hypothetical protein